MQKPLRINFLFVLILGILSMLTPLGIDMYLPAFGNIAQDLQSAPEQVQHTLAAFTFGLASGQLLWGPVGDSYGRKPIILLGVLVASLAAFMLTSVQDIPNFIWLRFVQGFFGAAPMVLVGALLRDLFTKNDFAKMMSMITLVLMVAPLLAPIVGGYLTTWWHWHSIFYVLVFIGLLSAVLVLWRIPETHSKEKRIPLRLGMVIRNFINLWKEPEVVGYMLMSAFSFAGMFAFLTAGSLVYIGVYGVSVQNFGYFFMMNIGVMTLGSVLNGRFVSKVGAERMLQYGLLVQFSAGIFLLLVTLFDLGFWPMAIGVAIFVGQNAIVGSNAMASILERFPTMAGTANSMVGTVRFGTGAIVSSLVALIEIHSAAPMLLVMSLCVLIAASAYYCLVYRHL